MQRRTPWKGSCHKSVNPTPSLVKIRPVWSIKPPWWRWREQHSATKQPCSSRPKSLLKPRSSMKGKLTRIFISVFYSCILVRMLDCQPSLCTWVFKILQGQVWRSSGRAKGKAGQVPAPAEGFRGVIPQPTSVNLGNEMVYVSMGRLVWLGIWQCMWNSSCTTREKDVKGVWLNHPTTKVTKEGWIWNYIKYTATLIKQLVFDWFIWFKIDHRTHEMKIFKITVTMGHRRIDLTQGGGTYRLDSLGLEVSRVID